MNISSIDYHSLKLGISNINFINRSDFKILVLNINRLSNKISALEYLLANLNLDFEAIILCETWATNSNY